MHQNFAADSDRYNCYFTIPRDYCAAFSNTYNYEINSTVLSLGALNELALTCSFSLSHPQLTSTPPIITHPTFVSFIDRFITSSDKHVLFNFSSLFCTASNLEFYTDGSLRDVGLSTIRMGMAWLQTHQDSPMVSFNTGLTSSFPSSAIPEFAALFTALLTAPAHCKVKIFTDSAVIISQFNKYKFLLKQSPTYLPFLKINNFVHWSCLFEVISFNNLEVSLIKVKAHSDNLFNNKVDALARNYASTSTLLLNTTNASKCFTLLIAHLF